MLTHSSTRTRLNVIDTERIDRVYLESPPLHAIFQTFIPTGISYVEERGREKTSHDPRSGSWIPRGEQTNADPQTNSNLAATDKSPAINRRRAKKPRERERERAEKAFVIEDKPPPLCNGYQSRGLLSLLLFHLLRAKHFSTCCDQQPTNRLESPLIDELIERIGVNGEDFVINRRAGRLNKANYVS